MESSVDDLGPSFLDKHSTLVYKLYTVTHANSYNIN